MRRPFSSRFRRRLGTFVRRLFQKASNLKKSSKDCIRCSVRARTVSRKHGTVRTKHAGAGSGGKPMTVSQLCIVPVEISLQSASRTLVTSGTARRRVTVGAAPQLGPRPTREKRRCSPTQLLVPLTFTSVAACVFLSF